MKQKKICVGKENMAAHGLCNVEKSSCKNASKSEKELKVVITRLTKPKRIKGFHFTERDKENIKKVATFLSNSSQNLSSFGYYINAISTDDNLNSSSKLICMNFFRFMDQLFTNELLLRKILKKYNYEAF